MRPRRNWHRPKRVASRPPPTIAVVSVRVEWVRYGREAAEALRSTISAAKGDEPLAPVTVVVPSNHVGVATRRLLASGALGPVCGRGIGVAAVSFLTVVPPGRASGLVSPGRGGRRPVSTPVIAAALRAALAERPGDLRAGGQPCRPPRRPWSPPTASSATSLRRRSRLPWPRGSDRAADVVRLHRAARAGLEPEWYDEEDLSTSAVGDPGHRPAPRRAISAPSSSTCPSGSPVTGRSC